MNHTYALTRNVATGLLQAVPETAKTRSKRGIGVGATALALLCATSPALADVDIDSIGNTVIGTGGGTHASPWNIAGWLSVGNSGNSGDLTVSGGGVVSNTHIGWIGYDPGGVGVVTITGAGSQWTTNGSDMRVGASGGNGTLNIESGGQVSSGTGDIGFSHSGSIGTVTVTGAGSRWTTNNNELRIGEYGTGALTIADGGEVISGFGVIGKEIGSNGTVTVTGAGQWMSTSNVAFDRGTGVLNIGKYDLSDTAGTVSAGKIFVLTVGSGIVNFNQTNDIIFAVPIEDNIAVNQRGSGKTTLTSASQWGGDTTVSGGTLEIDGGNIKGTGGTATLGVADTGGGVARLVVKNGGVADFGGGGLGANTHIGRAGKGAATVTGAGSTLLLKDPFIGHSGGEGELTVEAGGKATSNTFLSIGATNNSQGAVTVTGAGSSLEVQATSGIGLLVAGGGSANGGTLTVADGGRVTAWKTHITANGSGLDTVGTVNLNGTGGARGVLETGQVSADLSGGRGGTAKLNFDGGVLRATASEASFVHGFYTGEVTIDGGGAFIDSNGFAIGIGAVLGGTGGLTRQGAGTLTLSGANTYTGATTVSAGTLALSGGGSIADSSGVQLADAAGAAFDISAVTAGATIKGLDGGGAAGGNVALGGKTLTIDGGGDYAGILSGAGGSLVKSGAGTLTLAGGNTYTGATTVNGGTLVANHDGALGTGAVTVDDSADMDATLRIAGGVSLINSVTLQHGGALDNAGDLRGTAGSAGSAGVPVFAFDGSGNGLPGNGGDSGNLGGVGVRVEAASQFANTGTLRGGIGGTGGNGSAGAPPPPPGIGTYQGPGGAGGAGGQGGSAVELAGAGPLTNDGTMIGGKGGTGGAGGAGGIGSNGVGAQGGGHGGHGGSGGHGLHMTGAGQFINLGSITGGDGGDGGAGGAVGTDGSPVPGTAGDAGTGGTGLRVDADGASVVNAGLIAGGAGGTQGKAVEINGNDNTLELRSGWSFSGGISVVGSNNVLALGGATDAGFNLSSLAADFAGFASHAKRGAATWTLTGSTAVTGGWTVESGTLAVNGSIASAVTVQSGGTLGGSGTVGGTTVESGGRLAPGNSIGTLNVAGNLTLNAGSITEFELGSPGTSADPTLGKSDRIAVTGDLDFNGTVNLYQSGDAADGTAGLGYYRLITYGGALTGNTAVIGATPAIASAQYELQAGSGRVDLFISSTGGGGGGGPAPGDSTLQHWRGGDGLWGGSGNWMNLGGAVPADWAGINAVFKDAGGTSGGTITVAGAQSFQSIQFVDVGYRLQGAGQLVTGAAGGEIRVLADSATIATAITGAGSLRKTEAGTLILTGDNTYGGGTVISAGTLQIGDGGTSGAIVGNVANDGVLVFNRGDAVSFAGAISGRGEIRQVGPGLLDLAGDSGGFAGSTTVAGGTLAVNGRLGGTLDVRAAGRLQGAGTVGDTRVAGTIAPGNSIGTLHVAGDIAFAAGSVYEVEVDAAGQADRIDATGTATLDGGSVRVLAGAGDYAPQTRYTILSAIGGRTGAFAGVTSNLAFLDPSLGYDANNVYLTMSRNDISFAGIGFTPNQTATGQGVESLGLGAPVFDAVLNLSADQARAAFDGLSGEIHASLQSALVEESRFARSAAIDRLRAAQAAPGASTAPVAAHGAARVAADHAGPVFWAHGFGSWGSTDGDGNAARQDRDSSGLLVGADRRVGDWRLGVMAGYGQTRAKVSGRDASASSRDVHLGVYGGTAWGDLALRAGAAYAWHEVETRRVVIVPGLAERLRGDYRTGAWQAFGELGYGVEVAGARVEPFANLVHVRLQSEGFTEKGGAAALSGRVESNVSFSTLGVRGERKTTFGATEATLSGTVGWRRAFGDVLSSATHRFRGADAFTVAGTPIARNGAVVEAGLDFRLSRDATFGVSYTGQLASDARDHGVKAGLSVSF